MAQRNVIVVWRLITQTFYLIAQALYRSRTRPVKYHRATGAGEITLLHAGEHGGGNAQPEIMHAIAGREDHACRRILRNPDMAQGPRGEGDGDIG